MKVVLEKHDVFVMIRPDVKRLAGDLAPELNDELVMLNHEGYKNILLDLSEVNYVDSTGLNAMLVGNRLCNEAGGKLVLTSVTPAVHDLFRISQLESMLHITQYLPDAIEMMKHHDSAA